jgi:hypothetical protein
MLNNGLKKPIFGVGINDADYPTYYQDENNKPVQCKIYSRWFDVIRRSHSALFHAKHPTYVGCSVAKEWLSFMVFRTWMLSQEWEGLQLDKDIKVKGNKHYAPDTCLFVPHSLNTLFTASGATKGEYPTGVTSYLRNGTVRYCARLSVEGKRKTLGYRKTPEAAYEVYKAAKNEEIKRQAELYPQWQKYILQHQLN